MERTGGCRYSKPDEERESEMVSRPGGRRLAAILSADVVGDSRLMSADEEGAFETLRIYRRVITDLGRVT
jgi:class 3 adenylate cyclase